jgi:hypothetical protein
MGITTLDLKTMSAEGKAIWSVSADRTTANEIPRMNI